MSTTLQDRMADYIRAFAQNGVVILPGLFSERELSVVQAAIERVKHAPLGCCDR